MSSVPEIEEEVVSGGCGGKPAVVLPERSTEKRRLNGGGEGGVDSAFSGASDVSYCYPDRRREKTADPESRDKEANPVQNGERKGARGVVGEGRLVDPMCINASNPYHHCTERCSQRTGTTRRQAQGGKSASTAIPMIQNGRRNKEEYSVMGRRNVDPMCINASNPYHQCREYCFHKTPELNSRTNGAKSAESTEILVTGDNRKVDPRCVNASNPFHKCTEHCSQRSNGIVQNGGGKSETSSATLKRGVRRDVDPKCINASNPYHKCARYCVRRLQEAS